MLSPSQALWLHGQLACVGLCRTFVVSFRAKPSCYIINVTACRMYLSACVEEALLAPGACWCLSSDSFAIRWLIGCQAVLSSFRLRILLLQNNIIPKMEGPESAHLKMLCKPWPCLVWPCAWGPFLRHGIRLGGMLPDWHQTDADQVNPKFPKSGWPVG